VAKKEEKHACPSAGFEPTIPTIERPQNYSLDRLANGIRHCISLPLKKLNAEHKCWLVCTFLPNTCMHHVQLQQNNSLSHST
jgi:hypothetical protein